MFDHHSRDYADNWQDVYRHARESACPVIHSPNYGGYDVLTTHAAVLAAATDHRRLSSERSWAADGTDLNCGVSIPPRPVRLGFLEMDPPESLKYRRQLNKWFTRGAIQRGRDRIGEIATWAVDRVIEAGQCDLVVDLVSPFQRAVLLDLLGLPLETWLSYRQEVSEDEAKAAESGSAEEPIGIRKQRERAALFEWLRTHLIGEIAKQREEGGPGVLADLARAEIDGELISLEMATELAVMLVGGGDETTIATICSAILHLAQHPEDRELLTRDSSRIPTAVDEILRYYPATFTTARNVREPVSFSGRDFSPGDRILLAIASANFDGEVFDDPETVDLSRQANTHLTFGVGAHRCIGALLARANIECFLGEFLQRIPDFEIDRGSVIRGYEDIARINGYYSIPMTYSPGDVKGSGAPFPTLSAGRISPS
ncbi:cytochrome P450 [Streptomyces sp. NPDC055722]